MLNQLFKKPKLIIVVGDKRDIISDVLFHVFSKYTKTKKVKEKVGVDILLSFKVLILKTKSENPEYLINLINKADESIVVINSLNDNVQKLIDILPESASLVLNYDVREIGDLENKVKNQVLTFGFEEGASFKAEIIELEGKNSLKVNHRGNSIPFWSVNDLGDDYIYSALAASAAGEILGVNLLRISEALKDYQG